MKLKHNLKKKKEEKKSLFLVCIKYFIYFLRASTYMRACPRKDSLIDIFSGVKTKFNTDFM